MHGIESNKRILAARVWRSKILEDPLDGAEKAGNFRGAAYNYPIPTMQTPVI